MSMQFVIVTSFWERMQRVSVKENKVMLVLEYNNVQQAPHTHKHTYSHLLYSLSWQNQALQWKIEHATNSLRWSGVWIIISVVLLVSIRITRWRMCHCCPCWWTWMWKWMCTYFFVVTFVFISHYWWPLLLLSWMRKDVKR